TPRQPMTAVPYAQGLAPGAVVQRESFGPTLQVHNGFPALAVLLTKSAIDAFTSDGTSIRAYAGEGIGVDAWHASTSGTSPAIQAKSASTAALASAFRAELTAETPGFLSSA